MALGREKKKGKSQDYIELYSKRKFTEKGTWWLLDGLQKFGRIQSNRPVSWINCRVSSRIFLLISSGKSLLPYINSCVKPSFEGLVSPNGNLNIRTLARRSLDILISVVCVQTFDKNLENGRKVESA